jgi:hypothetical protein
MKRAWFAAVLTIHIGLLTMLPIAAHAQHYDRYGYGHGGGQSIRCESRDYRDRYCPADTYGGVRVARQLSNTACYQGRNWGYDEGGIWVSDGCAAEFVTNGDRPDYGHGGYGYGYDGYGYDEGYGRPSYGRYRYGHGYSGRMIRCESRDFRDGYCRANIRQGADIVRQISRSPCQYGRTWGYDRRGIWVTDGCAAEFAVR